MIIQIDTREHKYELARVQRQLERLGVKTINSKLYVGDYQSLDNPRLVVDRKKDLLELCGNVCQQHDRFRRELVRAQDAGIRIIILCEHGEDVRSLEDVYFWKTLGFYNHRVRSPDMACINPFAPSATGTACNSSFVLSGKLGGESWSC